MRENSVLLDTSVVVRHFRDPIAVVEKLAGFEELYLPQQALGELFYGAYKSLYPEKHLAQIEQFIGAADILTPDRETSELYGKIAARLAAVGTPIPQNDIWMAAMAMQCALPLATSDAHFGRVDGLKVLFW